MQQTLEDFKTIYFDFVREVMLVHSEIQKRSKGIISILGGGLPAPEKLLESPTINSFVDHFFSLDLPGLKREYEYNPIYYGLAEVILASGTLNMNTSKPILLSKLLYPLKHVGAGYSETLDEERLDKAINIYFDAWSQNCWVYDVAIPVYNLKATEQIKFGNFDLIEKGKLKEISYTSYAALENHQANWYLYLDLVRFESGGDKWRKLKIELQRIITGIRLVVANTEHKERIKIGLNEIIFTTFLYAQTTRFTDRADAELRVANYQLEPLVLELNQVPIVLDYIKFADTKYSALALAIRRYNFSLSREQKEDQLIDLTIALESSILYNKRDELKFRLAILGAAIVPSNFNKQMIFDLLGHVYDLRSKIVHNGEIYSPENKKIHAFQRAYGLEEKDFLCLLRETVRSILLQLIEKLKINSLNCETSNGATLLKLVLEKLQDEVIESLENINPKLTV